jgi:phage terminase large subunit-like protein
MTPATAAFYDSVTQRRLTHSGHPALARHVGNASVKIDAMGPRLKKEHRASPRKIDAAVAAVIAYARSQAIANEAEQTKPQVKFWSPVDV